MKICNYKIAKHIHCNCFLWSLVYFFYWLKCWIHLGDITKQLELSRFQKTCLERVLYMFSVYQFNITSWERLSWLISKEMDPTIPTCCGFGIIIFLFVPVFLFYYFSLNYYFSNIRSDSWGKMLLVIWVVTGDLRGQCLMSHCLMIRKCACHQTMLLFHYLEMPFLSYCYIDFLYPCGFSTHSLFKKKTTTLLLAYTLFCTQTGRGLPV